MTCTIRTALREATKALGDSPTPEIDSRALLKHATGLDDAGLIANERRDLSFGELEWFDAAVRRRIRGEPVSQIVGYREFWGLRFDVAPGILTPRPDTETLIEAVLKRRPDRQYPYRILDLGVGSGCLLGVLLTEYPKAIGLGVDIDPVAIELARRNIANQKVSARASCVESNWCAAINGVFDIIVSNPPYIRDGDRSELAEDVLGYENDKALFGGADGLDAYRSIAAGIGPLIASEAIVVVEAGAGQADEIAKIFNAQNSRFTAEFDQDLAGHRRAVILQGP